MKGGQDICTVENLHGVSQICTTWMGYFQFKIALQPGCYNPTPHYPRIMFHRFAFEGIENPLVIKSKCFSSIPFLLENKLFTFSFTTSFFRSFRSSCSASTFAVNNAVSAFLMLLSGFSLFVCFFWKDSSATEDSSTVAVFFLFLPAPGNFFSECVRP